MRSCPLALIGLLCIGPNLNAGNAAPQLKHVGMFIAECSLPGETRKDDVVPRHACCVRAAKARWLIVYTTHGYRGVDDERSVIYQIRKDAPDGPVVKEGFLAKAMSDWKPPGVPAAPEGKTYFKQHGHAVVYGVPRGALVGNKPGAPHVNRFVAQWRVVGRLLSVKEDRLEKSTADPVLHGKTQDVEWVEFRLNEREDDIEIVVPVRKMRPKTGKLPGAWMNQTFCPPVPLNFGKSQWVMVNHFDKGRIAALKISRDFKTGRYEWIETGPMIDADKRPLSEASIARWGPTWLITARTNGQIAYTEVTTPFHDAQGMRFWKVPTVSAPHTMFRCADGQFRLFTGDASVSEQKYDRDPLYMWDLEADPPLVQLKNRRVVFDSIAQKLDMRREVRPRIDFATLFPPHGREQLVVHGITPRAYNHPYEGTNIPAANARDKAASGLYYSRLIYPEKLPIEWRFE